MSLTKLILNAICLYVGCCINSSATISFASGAESKTTIPNILLVVADDLGFTDLGSFGSEISTPNLDGLALQGVRLTNLYSAPTCSPTRTMLLSGMDHHLAGMGTMSEDIVSNQIGKPGYEGYLNDRVVSLPELLKTNGYHTYMAGKWHLGKIERALPSNNGFDKTFALLAGGASHLNQLPLVGPGNANYVENGEATTIPENFYSTKFYTDKMIKFIRSKPNDGRPFFGYLAYTAPHWPLQAPKASIVKQEDKYSTGYEKLYEDRLNRLVELKIAPTEIANSARKVFETKWSSLNKKQRETEARKMEIYAAMISDIDENIGRIIDTIDQSGVKDNTIIIFLSDNGPEGNNINIGWDELSRWVAACCDNSLANMGSGDSYLWQGPDWASAVAGPFGRFKGWTHEGGIRVPGFVYIPRNQTEGRIDATLLSVMDIFPTLLDFAQVKHPGSMFQGRNIEELQGRSWFDLLSGEQKSEIDLNDRVFAWELFGKRAVRQGNWKLVSYPPPHGNSRWQLYNLDTDPLERTNLATRYPKKVKKLGKLWEEYALTNGVVLPNKPIAY